MNKKSWNRLLYKTFLPAIRNDTKNVSNANHTDMINSTTIRLTALHLIVFEEAVSGAVAKEILMDTHSILPEALVKIRIARCRPRKWQS